MALEDIFKALETQARHDVDGVLAEARERAAAILGEAETQAAAIREKHASDAEHAAGLSAMQELNAAKLEARRRLSGVRQGAVSEAFARARVALKDVRGTDAYPGLLARLIEEALEGVDGERAVLVDPRDEELAKRILAERGEDPALVRADIDTAGGVIVETRNGRVSRRNTLEDRLEKYTASAQSAVAEALQS